MLDTKCKVASVTSEMNFKECAKGLKANGYFDASAFEAKKFIERQGFKCIKNSKIITLEKPCAPFYLLKTA